MLNFSGDNWQINDIETVLFDKDGTFLDDHIYWGKLAENRVHKIIKHFNLDEKYFEDLCFAIGYNPKTCKLIKNGAIGVLSRNEVINFVVKKLVKYHINTDFETMDKLFAEVHAEFMNNMEKYVKILPFAEEFIKKLKKSGLKLAVVTSDTHKHTEKILKILKINEYFDIVIGKDDTTKEKRTGEPALYAINKLQTTPDKTLVIGDAYMDFEMSKNADVKGCILVATGQTDFEDLKKLSCNVVYNLNEVKIN